jgi:hypothetical protein
MYGHFRPAGIKPDDVTFGECGRVWRVGHGVSFLGARSKRGCTSCFEAVQV